MRLNDQQFEAIKRLNDWYHGGDPRCFVLAGYAGTGKTSVVSIATEVLNLRSSEVLYTAYTGKAVNVLRTKGLPARTIHKTFYNIFRTPEGRFFFSVKRRIPASIRLIVVDEASMVNDKMLNDIRTFDVPIVLLGDPMQLPPITGVNSMLEDINKLDVILTDVMRQDDGSGVLDLATRIRHGDELTYGRFGTSRIISMSEVNDLTTYDTILCWKNDTRRRFNQILRDKHGIKTLYPIKGEKLICVETNYFHKIDENDMEILPVNGLSCIARDDVNDNTDLRLKYSPPDIEQFFDTRINREIFDGYKTGVKVKSDDSETESVDDVVKLDFAYAITVHKSQGSEWDKVLVLDEYKGPGRTYQRWLYTAVTRARSSVDIVTNM